MEEMIMQQTEFISWFISILLSIITFFTVTAYREQRKFNERNSKEHKEIERKLTVGGEYFKKVDSNGIKIEKLDERVDGHDIAIEKLKGNITYKKVI